MRASAFGAAILMSMGLLPLSPARSQGVVAIDQAKLANSDTTQRRSPLFEVPAGFVVERVAGPPLVERPMMAGFDDQGRLFVCDSSGFNLLKGSSDILVKDPPHAIRMLEDTDGDGRFDKSTLFADKMTFPMGALWYEGALYTASPPSIWRLTDTDGDGVADRREEFITKVEFGGNACDIHGPFLGPDGRIYWANCIRGFEIREPGGKILKGKAAGLFRVRGDGSDVEIVCAGGMDNPVEVAFTEEGEAFATVNLLIGAPQPRMDAIIHCVDGGVFPYRELSKEFKRTGDLLPAMIDLGWVAPAGLMRSRTEPSDLESNNNVLFSTHFNRHRVQRHILERDGATFRGHTEDFVVSTDTDFHPTDILEDADGSLLVIDTGGWFLRGCPTSQIAKPEIKGAIYRIRRVGTPGPTDPRGLALNWDKLSAQELATLFDDSRWVVRDRAIHEFTKRGGGAIGILAETARHGSSPRLRRNAVWALTRLASPEAAEAVADALSDPDGSVRIAACHSLGLNRVFQGLPRLTKLVVADELPAVRREAATALGRIGDRAAVPALLDAVRAGGDRFLEHAQIYALIEVADRSQTLIGLQDESARVRRAALIALDQMEDGGLTRELVVPHLDSADSALQRAALTVITARPEWADAVAGLMHTWLAASELSDSRREGLAAALLAFCRNAEIQEVVADAMSNDKTAVPARLLLLEAMAAAPLEQLPESWLTEIGRSLQHRDQRVVSQAVATLRTRGVTSFDAALLELGRDSRQPPQLRVTALAAVAPRLNSVESPVLDFLRSQLDPERSPLVRLAAADAISSARLNETQLVALLDAVPSAGPLELPRLVAAFERSTAAEIGIRLVAALDRAAGLASVPPEALRRTLKDYPDKVRQAAEPLFHRLELDTETQRARLAELESVLAGGDARRGRGVFFGAHGACASCHTIQSNGGKVGPDLSKIGAIRTGRDLLESIVFPSASFVRSYEPFVVTTTEGSVYSGYLSRETSDAIHLMLADRTERRISRSSVDEIAPGRVSIMPQGLDAQLTQQELADLIAYLVSLK